MRSSRNSEPSRRPALRERIQFVPEPRGPGQQGDPPLARPIEAGDAIEHGGLPGAVGADECRDMAAIGLLSLRITDGSRLPIRPRGFHAMIRTMAKPNSNIRY